MAADPTLADLLDRQAGECGCLACTNDRAAAVRLRKLDAIEEAIGDVDVFRDDIAWVNNIPGGRGLADVLRRIADALGGTEP